MSMAPGWYPDPFSRGYLRWWDGTAWATATRLAEEPLDAPPVPQPTAAPQPPAAAPQQPAAPQYPAAPAYPPVQPYPGAPQYGAPPQQYGAPPQQYGAPPQQYGAPPAYGGPPPGAPGYPPQQPPWSGYQPYPPPAPQPTVPLASWGQRFAARLIDWLILAVVLVPLYLVTLWPAFTDLINQIPTDPSQPLDPNVIFRFEQRVIGQALLLGLIGAVVQMVYEVPQLAAYGRTVGMRVIGLRVRPLATDRNPSWGESLIRTGVAVGGNLVAGVIFTLIDDLWPLWDKPWRQAIHDKAAKTIVVLK